MVWRKAAQLRVLMVPDATAQNPYQRSLCEALEQTGVLVKLTSYKRIFIDIFKHRPNVIHIHWIETTFLGRGAIESVLRLIISFFVFSSLRVMGVKLIWTFHNFRNHQHRNITLNNVANRLFGRLSHSVIALSPHSVEILTGFGIAKAAKVFQVAHGNYINAYENNVSIHEARKQLGFPKTATVFLFVGSICPYKGVLDLISAFRKVEGPDLVLAIAGKSSDDDYTQKIIEQASMDNRVMLFLSFVPESMLQVYLNACDAVILPFTDILNSGSVWLSMSFGRCSIVPDKGAVDETIDESTGYVYPSADPEGLVNAIKVAARSRAELCSRGAAALKKARATRWDEIAKATKEIYMG